MTAWLIVYGFMAMVSGGMMLSIWADSKDDHNISHFLLIIFFAVFWPAYIGLVIADILKVTGRGGKNAN